MLSVSMLWVSMLWVCRTLTDYGSDPFLARADTLSIWQRQGKSSW